jgi:hypothetical protein
MERGRHHIMKGRRALILHHCCWKLFELSHFSKCKRGILLRS